MAGRTQLGEAGAHVTSLSEAFRSQLEVVHAEWAHKLEVCHQELGGCRRQLAHVTSQRMAEFGAAKLASEIGELQLSQAEAQVSQLQGSQAVHLAELETSQNELSAAAEFKVVAIETEWAQRYEECRQKLSASEANARALEEVVKEKQAEVDRVEAEWHGARLLEQNRVAQNRIDELNSLVAAHQHEVGTLRKSMEAMSLSVSMSLSPNPSPSPSPNPSLSPSLILPSP